MRRRQLLATMGTALANVAVSAAPADTPEAKPNRFRILDGH